MRNSSTQVSLAPINTPTDCMILDHLNKTSSLSIPQPYLPGDSSLPRFITRWCCYSATISEGCLYSIKKNKRLLQANVVIDRYVGVDKFKHGKRI